MVDLAVLELRIRSLEVSRAEERIERLARAGRKAERGGDKLTRAFARQNANAKKLNATYRNTTRLLGPLGAALAGGALFVTGVRSIADFEQGLVGVQKTTGLATAEIQELGNRLQDLSVAPDLRVTQKTLLDIATEAGRLGVRGVDNLERFTETVARLGATSNLAGGEAAQTLARLTNVTNESIRDVDRLGTAITQLGDSFAANEAQIAQAGLSIAQNVSRFDVSSADALGLATAAASLGLQFEVTGTTIGRAMQEIDIAVRKGGDTLEDFASVARVSSDELRTAFEASAFDGLQLIIKGLGELQSEEGDATEALRALTLSNVRSIRILTTLANRYDLVTDAVSTSNAEYRTGTALVDRSTLDADTLKGSLTRLGQAFRILATDTGEGGFAGSLRSLIDNLTQTILILSGSEDALASASLAAQTLASAIKTLGIVLVALTIGKFIGLIVRLATVIASARTAMLGLNAVISANPIGAFISLMGLAVFATSQFAGAMDATDARIAKAQRSIDSFFTGSIKVLEQVDEIQQKLRRARSQGNEAAQAQEIGTLINTIQQEIDRIDKRIESQGAIFKISAKDLVEIVGDIDLGREFLEDIGGRELEGAAKAQGAFFAETATAALRLAILDLRNQLEVLDQAARDSEFARELGEAARDAREDLTSLRVELEDQLKVVELSSEAGRRAADVLEIQTIAALAYGEGTEQAEAATRELLGALDKLEARSVFGFLADEAEAAEREMRTLRNTSRQNADAFVDIEIAVEKAVEALERLRSEGVIDEGQFEQEVRRTQEAAKELKRDLEELGDLAQVREVGDTIGASIGGALKDAVFQTGTLKEALLDLSMSLVDIFATRQIEEFISNAFVRDFGPAQEEALPVEDLAAAVPEESAAIAIETAITTSAITLETAGTTVATSLQGAGTLLSEGLTLAGQGVSQALQLSGELLVQAGQAMGIDIQATIPSTFTSAATGASTTLKAAGVALAADMIAGATQAAAILASANAASAASGGGGLAKGGISGGGRGGLFGLTVPQATQAIQRGATGRQRGGVFSTPVGIPTRGGFDVASERGQAEAVNAFPLRTLPGGDLGIMAISPDQQQAPPQVIDNSVTVSSVVNISSTDASAAGTSIRQAAADAVRDARPPRS